MGNESVSKKTTEKNKKINIKRIRSKGKKGFRGSVGGFFEMERK